MRIKTPAPEANGKPAGPGTRATRSSAHAQKRQDNRHAERDYFGNVIERPQASARPTVGSALEGMGMRGGLGAEAAAARAAAARRGDAGEGTRGVPAIPPTRPDEQGVRRAEPARVDAVGPMRLDAWLVARGMSPSREKAKASIAAGLVYVGGSNKVKASMQVGPDARVEVRGQAVSYVGRGGLKLERALDAFGLDATGMTAVDLGASTGGFTDCLLQRGAARVLAVDVGHGQLDPALARDPRVVSLEGVDARTVTRELVEQSLGGGAAVDLVTADLSFIGLGHVLPAIAMLLDPGSAAVLLVKPQFEAGKERVGKKGVVKDPAVHREVLTRVLAQAREAGMQPRGLDFSPVKGPEGNIEYLLYAVRTTFADPTAELSEPAGSADPTIDVRAVVDRAHAELARS